MRPTAALITFGINISFLIVFLQVLGTDNFEILHAFTVECCNILFLYRTIIWEFFAYFLHGPHHPHTCWLFMLIVAGGNHLSGWEPLWSSVERLNIGSGRLVVLLLQAVPLATEAIKVQSVIYDTQM